MRPDVKVFVVADATSIRNLVHNAVDSQTLRGVGALTVTVDFMFIE